MTTRPRLAVPIDANALAGVRPSVRVATAAQLLDVDRGEIYRLLDAGALEGHRKGKRGKRVYLDSLRAYQADNTLQPRRQLAAPAPPAAASAPRRKKPPTPPLTTTAHKEALAFLHAKGLV